MNKNERLLRLLKYLTEQEKKHLDSNRIHFAMEIAEMKSELFDILTNE